MKSLWPKSIFSKRSLLTPLFVAAALASVEFASVAHAAQPVPELQHTQFLSWALKKKAAIKGIPDDPTKIDHYYNQPVELRIRKEPIVQATGVEKSRIESTTQLYFKLFGRDAISSFLWSGIESGNPLTRHEDYRWDSLEEQGLYDQTKRTKIISSLLNSGIKNVRLGMSNHLIDITNDKTWSKQDEIMRDFSQAGIRISLDLHHFGIEDRFRVKGADGKTIGAQSYYLNPLWPDEFAKFAAAAVSRYKNSIQSITIMNEPETVVGFNGEMWHGGFPGWSDAQSNRYYIERCIQVAKASVKARIAIEAMLQTLPANSRPRFLYMHTEASVWKGYWSDFNIYRRHIISDMILGHEWLLGADLDWLKTTPMSSLVGRWHETLAENRTILDWVIENYLVYNQAAKDRKLLRRDLVAKLSSLRDLHFELESRFGKTMKTDTVLAVDYYAHNEDKGSNDKPLNPKPEAYVEEVKSGRRGGLYHVIVGYYNHYRMPVMVGESGTPYFNFGARWNQQMLLECADAALGGIPFLGYTLYPAVDTYGWESALSVPKYCENNSKKGLCVLFNPSGLLQLNPVNDQAKADELGYKPENEFMPKGFVRRFVDELSAQMPR